MMFIHHLIMKNYLIIGSSSGIGLQLSKLLCSDNHGVYGTYNQTEPSDLGSNYTAAYYDVNTEELSGDFLPEVIDGIAYCPGSINLKPFHRIKPDDFLSDLNLQVVGAIKVIQQALPRLKKAESPSIVLFSTVAVQMGFTFHTQVSTSKGAVEGLTRSLAAELAPKVRVNCIAPSLTDTPLASKLLSSDEKKEANAQRHPLKRIGKAEDVAQAAKFLLSDNSSWITGQVFHVDGGMSTLKI